MGTAVVFWACIGIIGVTYAGYPLLLALIGLIKGRPAQVDMEDWPKVSILMAVHNEEGRMLQAIRNNLENGYPEYKIEVIVCSDASTDGTNRLVEECGDPRVRLVTSPTQIGVNEVTALGAAQATGDLFLLTHAKTAFEKGAIQKLARHFADPKVGIATGRIIYRNPLKTTVGSGYKAYWLIETGVRAMEGRIGVGCVVVGAFEMIRREAYMPFPSQFSNDMTAPMYACSKGFLYRYELDAVQYTEQRKNPGQEFTRRLRMAVRGWSSIPFMRSVVPFHRSLRVWLVAILHKYLRWSTWLFMIGAFAANGWLLGSGRFYQVVFALQVTFYALALLGWAASAAGKRISTLTAPFYFCLLQAAGMVGLIQSLCGRRIGVWKPEN